MAKEIDVREHVDRTDDDRRRELHAHADDASAALPEEQSVRIVSFDSRTGNAAVVVSDGAEPGGGDYVQRALAHVQHIGGALGLTAEQPPEFVADPEYQQTSTGSVAVHLRQHYKGIPVYEATETVRFDPEGRITEVAGRTHSIEGEIAVAPALTPEDALRRGAEHVARPDDEEATDPFGQPMSDPELDVGALDPIVTIVHPGRADQAVTFDVAPFEGQVTVSLVWFPLDGDVRLCWHMVLSIPAGPQYRVLVDAGDGRILLCRQLAWAIVGRARVFLPDGGSAPQTVELPLPLDRYPFTPRASLPAGFPDDWLSGGTTDGFNARAVLADGSAARARLDGETAVFDPTPGAQDDDQLRVNLLALCGLMHDALYVLGFREPDGNFQRDNRGRGGRAADAVRAIVHPGAVWGTANMRTPADGAAPEMNMGLVSRTGRHTALDGDVVIHEYTHGLTNRLVGGPLDTTSLDGPQSGGMGEGWGDYMACVINGRTTVGSWVVRSTLGIRRHRYDEDFPLTYADVSTSRASEVHDIGEIWCAALLAMNRRIGAELGAQLVVDALKLSAANPSMLAMRDAILVAARDHAAQLDAGAAASLERGIWEAFARFGMGPNARTNGDTLSGIVADFEPPVAPEPESDAVVRASASPNLAIPDDDDNGIVSTLTLASAGTIASVEISVEIEHTYRGDLVVALVAPGGARVTLHHRAGGREDDLVETWSSASHDGLGALAGGRADGTWELHVSDHAAVDVGTLRLWSLAVGIGAARPSASVEVRPGLRIPDDADGVESRAALEVSGTIRRLALEVDVTHTYVGDLVVALRGPSGREVLVHDRTGENADNIIATYTSDDEPLSQFVGDPAGGEWTLTVTDEAAADVGKLNRWKLTAET